MFVFIGIAMYGAQIEFDNYQRLRETNNVDAAVKGITSRIPTLAECLTQLLVEKGLKRPSVVAAANINETFGYQIFVGQRHASRDKLLSLCIAMETTVEEANRVLRSGGLNELNSAYQRDAIIIHGMLRGRSLQQIEQSLYDYGYLTLHH